MGLGDRLCPNTPSKRIDIHNSEFRGQKAKSVHVNYKGRTTSHNRVSALPIQEFV